MAKRRRLDEDLKGAGHQMDRIGGDSGGLVKKTVEDSGLEGFETELKKIGKEWPRDHNDTAAMCDVDEDGVEHEPQGVHKSENGEPTDGITKKTGHDWPKKPKNSGGGVAEPFGNHHRTDDGLQGGDIAAGHGPSGSAPNGHSANEWTVRGVDGLMNESEFNDEQLQGLFNEFARGGNVVCLEDFSELLAAHGVNNVLDETGFINLLAKNPEFTFHEQEDSDGRYWLAEGLPAFLKDKAKKDKSGEDCDDCDEDDDKPAFLKSKAKKSVKEWLDVARKVVETQRAGRINEHVAARALLVSLNCSLDRDTIRAAATEDRKAVNGLAKRYKLRFDESIQRLAESPFDMGGEAGPAGPSRLDAQAGEFDPNDPNAIPGGDGGFGQPGTAGLHAGVEPGLGGEHVGGPSGKAGLTDPALSGDLGGGLGGDIGGDPGSIGAIGDQMGGSDEFGMGDEFGGPEGGLGGLGDDQGFGEPEIDPTTPAGGPFVQQPGSPGRSRFESKGRARKALSEEGELQGGIMKGGLKGAGHKMDHQGGESVSKGKASKSGDLPQDDTDTTEIKPKNLLGASQKNTVKDSQEFEDGGSGKLSNEDGLKENMRRLGRFVQNYLAEHDHGLRGKFSLAFNSKVDGKTASSSATMADVLADAEELLLLHGTGRVTLEAVYSDASTGRAMKSVIVQLPSVKPRHPVMTEGKVLFRFGKHAERFADRLVAEGSSCRLTSHNWGAAVHSKLPVRRLHRIFGAIIK